MTLAFGPFELRPDTGELRSEGRSIKLAPQPFQVLSLIVQGGGRLVTRESVRAAVWADGTTVEFDQGLNYCLRQIRIAIKDDARTPTYVETVPKRGYRLLVPARSVGAEPAAEQAPVVPPAPIAAPPRFTMWRAAAPSLIVAGIVLIGVWVAARAGNGASAPIDPKAQRLFVEAEHLAETWEPGKVAEATSRYEEAVGLEPRYAAAWAGLANADIVSAYVGADLAGSLTASEAHARRALEIDPTLSIAHAALGHSDWHQWQWQEADGEFTQAMAGDKPASMSHQLYGLYLASMGRKDDAVAHARRAVELAPTSGLHNYALAQVYLQTGHFEEAIAQAERTLEFDRHFSLAYQTLISAHAQLGQLDAAWRALDDSVRYAPERNLEAWRAYLLARQGRASDALALLAGPTTRRRAHKSLGDAAAFVAAGDPDAAFAVLNAGVSAHAPSLLWLRTAPELAPLRLDARFVLLLERMHWR